MPAGYFVCFLAVLGFTCNNYFDIINIMLLIKLFHIGPFNTGLRSAVLAQRENF